MQSGATVQAAVTAAATSAALAAAGGAALVGESGGTTVQAKLTSLAASVDPTLRADLASSTGGSGSALVAYLSPGTGANARTMYDFRSEQVRINALDFIAPAQIAAIKAGTSTYNAGPDIQKAIDAVAAAGGGVVLFPKGVYRTQQTLLISTQGVYLEGLGGGSNRAGQANVRGSAQSRIEWDPGNTPAAGTAIVRFAPPVSSGALSGGGIAKLMLDGQTVCPIGLNIVSWNYANFSQMAVIACTADQYLLETANYALTQTAGASQHNRFDDCYCYTQGGSGWYLTTQANGWRFKGGSSVNSGDSSVNTLVNCQAQMSMGNGFVLENVGQNFFASCWASAPYTMTTPVNTTHVVFTSGGSIGPGTYWYRVVAENAVTGELTAASAETSIVVASGTTNRVQLVVSAVPGATHYRGYGRTSGGEQFIGRVAAGGNLFDTGAAPNGAIPAQHNAHGVILGSTDQATNTGATGVARYHCFLFCEMSFYARASQQAGGTASFGNMIWGVSNGNANNAPVTFEVPVGNTNNPQATYTTSGTGPVNTAPATGFFGKVDIDANNPTVYGYYHGGVQVVGPRQAGWTAGSGTPGLGAFNANTTYVFSASYTQSELNTIGSALLATRQRVLALEAAMRTHGLIG